MTLQRYVSQELTHFVGRALSTNEERYERLLRVLRDGELRSRDPSLGSTVIYAALLFPEGAKRYEQSMVCFCDIPEADLAIHMSKYGPFGLAFTKDFLMQRGARPVFYISTTTTGFGTTADGSDATLADQFNDLVACLGRLQRAMSDNRVLEPDSEWYQDLVTVLGPLLEERCLMFVKGFDPRLQDSDTENSYMEREWRVQGARVAFSVEDVHRVLLPEAYAARFRADVPEYANQLVFVDRA